MNRGWEAAPTVTVCGRDILVLILSRLGGSTCGRDFPVSILR